MDRKGGKINDLEVLISSGRGGYWGNCELKKREVCDQPRSEECNRR